MNRQDYEEAIQELSQALAINPEDAEAAYYLGVALVKVGKNRAAEQQLEKLIARNPQFTKAHFDLGVAKYHLGKYQEALRSLQKAERAGPGKAMVYYYEGLAYHRLGDYERSSPRFLRAVAIAPQLRLTSHYYAGVGYYRRGVLAEAREELQEVVRVDARSQVGRSAQEFLFQIDKLQKKVKPWEFALHTVYQYDSNVVLVPGGAVLPQGISRKGDSRLVVHARGSYEALRTLRWTLGGKYSFYQSLHGELSEFDVQSHEIGTRLLYRQGRAQLRVPYRLTYS